MANDSDAALKILIEFGYDPAQARAALSDLEKYKKGAVSQAQILRDSLNPALAQSSEYTDAAAKKAGELHIKHGALHKLFSMMPGPIQEFGHALRFAFAGGVLGVIGGVVVAVKFLHDTFAKFHEQLKVIKMDGLTKGMKEAGAATREAAEAMEHFWEATKKQADQQQLVNDLYEDQRQVIQDNFDATEKVIAAQENAGMMAGTSKGQREKKFREDMIKANEAEIEHLKRLAPEIDANVAARNQEALAVRAQAAERASAYENAKAQMTAMDTAGRPLNSKEIGAYRSAHQYVYDYDQARPGIDEGVRYANARESAAKGRAGDFYGRLRTLGRQNEQFRSRNLTLGIGDAEASSFGGPVDVLRDAAAGADAIQAGGRATRLQAIAMEKAAALFNLQGVTSEQLIAILGRMNDDMATFNRSLKALEQRANLNRNP